MAKLIYCTSNSFISEREIESLLYFLSYHHQFVYYLTPSAVTFLTFHKYKYDICHYLIGKHILLSLIFSVSLFCSKLEIPLLLLPLNQKDVSVYHGMQQA